MGPAREYTGKLATWITFGILAAGTSYVALRISGPYIESLLTGAALAVLCDPLYLRLRRHLRWPSIAAIICTLIVIVTLVVPIGLVIATVVRELRQAYQALGPGALGNGADRFWAMLDPIAMRFGSSADELRQMAQSRLDEAGTAIVKQTFSAAGAATSGVIQLIVVIGALNVFLLNGAWLREQTLAHSPIGAQRTEGLLESVRQMIVASFYGVVAVATAQGTLMGLAAWWVGLPIPALWGVAAAVFSVLPLFGSALVWIPATVLLLVAGRTGAAIFILIWGAAVVANADNLIRPMIVMAKLPVSGLLVFIAILGGVRAFGPIGILVGPVTLALGLALLKILREDLSREEVQLK
ncbi:MAG: AI-2E family transporter [Acidobacteriota bacterium]